MLKFGILAPTTLGVCGQSTDLAELQKLWQGILADDLVARFHFVSYASQSALEQAFLQDEVQAIMLDRNCALPAPPGTQAFVLNERWIGTLYLNGGSPLFADFALRRDFGLMAQTLARSLFPQRGTDWVAAPTFFSACFLPDGVFAAPEPGSADVDYYQRPLPALSVAEFAARWREHLQAHPLRLIHTPGRGALSTMQNALIAAFAAQRLAIDVITIDNAPQVYQRVAQGGFDVVSRGWGEDENDPDGFIGSFEKQPPANPAHEAYQRFYQSIAALGERAQPGRAAAYAQALRTLEDEWLFVPICQDKTRLLLRLPDAA
jgi:hypothetical protein